jgi:hypothetical protein
MSWAALQQELSSGRPLLLSSVLLLLLLLQRLLLLMLWLLGPLAMLYSVGIVEILRTFPLCGLTVTGNTLLMESSGQKAVMLSAFLSDGGVPGSIPLSTRN